MSSALWQILLIDDDEEDQLLIGEMLKSIQRRQTRIELCSSYSAGLHALQNHSFDAILVDYDLGARNGVEWIREAIAQGCSAPMIVVTGRGRYAVDLEAMQAGASEYLTKADLNATLLERAIRYAIERKQTEDDLRSAKEQLEQRVEQRTRQLEQREDLLNRVLEVLPVGVWITDAQGLITRGNPAGLQIWAGARYVGMEQYGEYKGWWLDSGQPIQPDEWAVVRAITHGQTSLDEEIEIQCFDGSRKLILNSAVPIRDDAQAVMGAIIVNQDITARKQADTSLRQANELLEKVFNSLHLAIAYLDRDFNFIRVNRMYAAFDGRSETFFPGQNHFDLYPNAENEAIFRAVLETGQPFVTHAKPFSYKDYPERGTSYWDWSLQPVREPDGAISGLVISLLNVTDFKHVQDTLHITNQLERQAQAEAAKLRTVIDAMQDPIMVYDAQGTLIQANPAAAYYNGFDPVGKTNQQLIHLLQACYFDSTPITFENMPSSRALRGQRLNGELVFLTNPLGRAYALQVSAAPLYLEDGLFGAVVVWHDISEQKRFEKALEEALDRNTAILEDIRSIALFPDENPSPVLRISADGIVQYINTSGTALLSSLGFQQGRPAPQDVRALVQAALQSGERSRLDVKVGGRTFSLLFAPIQGSGYVNLYGQDVTEIRQAESEQINHIQQLEKLNARLEQLNKELKDFVFAASHDLQEPLRKIQSFGQLLQESQDMTYEETCSYIDRMVLAAARMQGMIDDLLDLSRVTTQGGHFIPVDLTAIAAEVLQDLELSLQEAGGQVLVETLPVVTADPVQMRQLLQNLIGNAIKFRKPETPPQVKVGVKRHTPHSVTIFIEDNGIGFEMAALERVFQPFQRLHSRSEYAGSGIGLAICRRITERHGGEITAIGAPGVGATFLITLPIAPAAGAAPPHPALLPDRPDCPAALKIS